MSVIKSLAWILIGVGVVFYVVSYLYKPHTRRRSPDGESEVRNADATLLVKDPVCGMSIDPRTDITWIHDKQLYHFCSMSCRGHFRIAPGSYAVQQRK